MGGELVEVSAARREEWRDWLALRMVRGVGPVVYQGLLRAFREPAAVFGASVHALECAGVRSDVARAIRGFRDWTAADEQVSRAIRCGAIVLTWNDAAYPPLLRRIHDPPPVLFVRGRIEPADAQAVAIVGSRQASAYGRRVSREISAGLARCGLTVVSGLARGVDAVAHASALEAGGRTIAVLGCGVDVVYPAEHHALFRSIGRQGAVVSELWMGTQPEAEHFPARNRIISGVSLGLVVVEAGERSGSLITAGFAAEQGREVFAVPGAIGVHTRGTHRLLREGAKLTERAEDVVEELMPQLVRRGTMPAPALPPDEAAIRDALGDEVVQVDDLIVRCGLAPGRVLQGLLSLELRGVVEQLPGKRFVVRVEDGGRRRTQE